MSDNEIIRLRFIEQYENEYGPIIAEEVEPQSTSFHKATHAALICLDVVERSLRRDPVIMSDPELFELAEKASSALLKLYAKFYEKRADR